MKKILVLLVGASLLTSCADLFDSNYFAVLDVAPAPNAAALGSASLTDLTKKSKDPAFFESLKSDTTGAALKAVQDNLDAVMSSGTDAEKAEAAKTYIEITANSTETISVVNASVPTLLSLAGSGGASGMTGDAAGLQDMVGGFFTKGDGTAMTSAEIVATIEQFNNIANALTTLDSSTTTSDEFFAGTSAGSLAQIGVVSAAVSALMASASGATDAEKAQQIADLMTADPATINLSTSFPTLSTQMGYVTNAVSGTGDAGPYAYVGALMGVLPL